VNLELPFYELPDAELDAYLARIDEQLDALFLDDVQGALEAEPSPGAATTTAAAA
jgi:hypothetical protein